MSAPAVVGVDRPTLRIRGTAYPVLLPSAARPAAAPRRSDRLTAGTRAGRVRLPAVDRADPGLARSCRDPRGRDRVPKPARAHVARECPPDRKRRRLRPARAGHRARRLVEHERLVDLRRDVGDRAAVQVPHPHTRTAHLQPVELRARALFPAPGCGARGSARAVVGSAVPRARLRDRSDRRGRVSHPAAAAPRRGSPSVSGSRSPRGSACSRRAATR